MTKILLILTVLLSGCAGMVNYRTEVFIDGEKKAEMKSNVPAKATVEGVEIDQRSSGSWWEKLLPEKVNVEK